MKANLKETQGIDLVQSSTNEMLKVYMDSPNMHDMSA
jgi:hypothetical protein